MIKKEEEVWRTHPDYPFIEVSNLGRVRTKDRYVPNGENSKRLVNGHIMKQHLGRDGYVRVSISVSGKVITLLVHRAVAVTYIPNTDNLPEVNHKDNDKTNNTVSNLEWCSRKYNEAYKKNFGTSQSELFGRPVIAINPETSEVIWFESQREAGRQLGIDSKNVNRVVKGKRNKTHGWWFCYADEDAVKKTRAKFGDKVAKKVEKLMNEHYN